MNSRWRSALFCFCLTWSGALIGCSHGPPQLAPAEPPAVPVSHPVDREVTDYVDFTGRTDAVQSVDIRARVTGYLVKMPFKEGAEVKKDDLLVRGRPPALPGPARPGRGPGQPLPGPTQAGQDNLRPRPGPSPPRTPGAVSQQQLDQDQAAVDEADAAVKACQGEPGGLQAQPRASPRSPRRSTARSAATT